MSDWGREAEVEGDIQQLLRSAPERWSVLDVDALTANEQKALRLLTAAGMVERRFSMRLSLIGHPVRIDVTATATGDHGLAEAMGPVLRKSWDAWQEFWNTHRDGPEDRRPKVFCEKTEPEMWRLTEDGVLAKKDLDTGKVKTVLDYVLRQSPVFYGMVVSGHGRAERLEATRESHVPSQVEVTNLNEITGSLGAFAEIVQKGLEKLAEASSAPPPQPHASVGTKVPANTPPKTRRGKRGPKRLSLKEAWRYLTVLQAWSGIQERNQKLSMRDRVRKVQVAEKHNITVRELDAMLGWYAKHRGQGLFPDDPRTLSMGELQQWFE